MTKAFNFSLPGYIEDVYQTSSDDDVSDDTDLEPVDTNQSTYFECLPQHSACYAHTLQLVVKDGLKDAGNNNLKTIIVKASTVDRYVRQSLFATEIPEGTSNCKCSKMEFPAHHDPLHIQHT